MYSYTRIHFHKTYSLLSKPFFSLQVCYVPIPKTPVAHIWIRSNGSHICMWRRRRRWCQCQACYTSTLSLEQVSTSATFNDITNTETVNVQGVWAPQNVLKYFSKKDEQVSFYRTESALSFNYWARAGARAGARRTQTFRFSNPFVLEHLHH